MTISKWLTILVTVLAAIGTATAGTETTLYDFKGFDDGSDPQNYGHLVRDASGNLFGTTQFGGSCDQGTVFEVLPNGTGGWNETVLHAFCGGTDGSNPLSSVILDTSGNIYGTTSGAGNGTCGTVFKLSGTILTTLHTFTCLSDGGNPISGLIHVNNGSFFGTASGGDTGWGVVYEISRTGTFTVLYNFCQLSGCADGANPMGGLVRDSIGNLYGTTFNGGDMGCIFSTPGCGVVFELSKVGGVWTETVLHTFSGKKNDGANPIFASLTLVNQKINNRKALVIYGVTNAGGRDSGGTVFQMVRGSKRFSFKILHNYGCCEAEGLQPVGTLAFSKGHLFGTTIQGGAGESGTVFELSEKDNVWSENILYTFVNGEDGGHPYSGVVIDPSGTLYGTASSDGGIAGDVYQVVP